MAAPAAPPHRARPPRPSTGRGARTRAPGGPSRCVPTPALSLVFARPSPARRGLAAFFVLAAAGAAAPARAQQTIINVPSVDQTAKGRVFFLHESQVRDWGGERFWQTTHFLTYGVSKRFEVAATLYNVGSPFKQSANAGLGWKTAQPIADVFPGWAARNPGLAQWRPVVGAGQMVPVSLRGRGAGLWSYAQGAVTVPALGLRLMGGVSNGPPNLFAKHTTHFIGSYELPLTGLGHRVGGRAGDVLGHMSLLGEWWSGRHDLADFVPGVNYHTKSLVVIAGYKLGNTPGTRGDAIIFEIGRTF